MPLLNNKLIFNSMVWESNIHLNGWETLLYITCTQITHQKSQINMWFTFTGYLWQGEHDCTDFQCESYYSVSLSKGWKYCINYSWNCVKSTECSNTYNFLHIRHKHIKPSHSWVAENYQLACFSHDITEWVLIELTLVLYNTSWSSGFNSGSE